MLSRRRSKAATSSSVAVKVPARRAKAPAASVLEQEVDVGEGGVGADGTGRTQVRLVEVSDVHGIAHLQRRYLELALQALRAPHSHRCLGRRPEWDEISRRWTD